MMYSQDDFVYDDEYWDDEFDYIDYQGEEDAFFIPTVDEED